MLRLKTTTTKEDVRLIIAGQIAEFLGAGNRITQVPADATGLINATGDKLTREDKARLKGQWTQSNLPPNKKDRR